MWNRQEVKQQAKVIMKRNYWKMFVITLLGTILTGEGVSAASGANHITDSSLSPSIQSILLTIVSVAGLLGILYTFFIGNVIRVGKASYFLKNHDENPPLGEIFSAFKGNYLNVVKIMCIMYIKVLLWTFLLIVPGIIKAIEYSMIPYILAENPDISTQDAFSLSSQMTTGQKMDLFVLEISFFGWIFLGGLLCGVGTLFVNPYIEATDAEVYIILRDSISRE